MADNITAWLNSNTENTVEWDGTDLVENTNLQGGGLFDIIKYLCDHRLDEFDDLLRNIYYVEGDEKDDFKNISWSKEFVEDILTDAIVGIEEEARFIIATVYKYHQKKLFAGFEGKLLDQIELEGWTEEEYNDPTQVAVKIVKSHFSKIGPYSDVISYTQSYIKSYFNAKHDFIIEATVIDAEMYIKSGNFSGQKRKKILRALGASNKQVQEIRHNWDEIDNFINSKKLSNPKFDDDIIKTFKLNKELKPLVNNDLNKAKKLIRKGEFIDKFSEFSFVKKMGKALPVIDNLLTLKDAYNEEKMMDNFISGVGACFGPGIGFGVSAFLAVGNDHWDRVQQDLIEFKKISCGISWYEIVGTEPNSNKLKNPEFRDLLLQYKREEDEPYFNSDITFTSIRILDAQIAEEIFLFAPKFVNYCFPDSLKNLCRTRCY